MDIVVLFILSVYAKKNECIVQLFLFWHIYCTLKYIFYFLSARGRKQQTILRAERLWGSMVKQSAEELLKQLDHSQLEKLKQQLSAQNQRKNVDFDRTKAEMLIKRFGLSDKICTEDLEKAAQTLKQNPAVLEKIKNLLK